MWKSLDARQKEELARIGYFLVMAELSGASVGMGHSASGHVRFDASIGYTPRPPKKPKRKAKKAAPVIGFLPPNPDE